MNKVVELRSRVAGKAPAPVVRAHVQYTVRGSESRYAGEGEPLTGAFLRTSSMADVFVHNESELPLTFTAQACYAPKLNSDGALDVENSLWVEDADFELTVDSDKVGIASYERACAAFRIVGEEGEPFIAYVWERA